MQRIRRINPKHQFILRIRFALSLISAMEKSYDLRTCAAIVRSEQAFSNAVGDIVLHSPCHSVCIVAVGGNIGEAVLCLRLGRTCCTPQEGDDLGAGTGLVRSKEAVADAAGDSIRCYPLDRLIVHGRIHSHESGMSNGTSYASDRTSSPIFS